MCPQHCMVISEISKLLSSSPPQHSGFAISSSTAGYLRRRRRCVCDEAKACTSDLVEEEAKIVTLVADSGNVTTESLLRAGAMGMASSLPDTAFRHRYTQAGWPRTVVIARADVGCVARPRRRDGADRRIASTSRADASIWRIMFLQVTAFPHGSPSIATHSWKSATTTISTGRDQSRSRRRKPDLQL